MLYLHSNKDTPKGSGICIISCHISFLYYYLFDSKLKVLAKVGKMLKKKVQVGNDQEMVQSERNSHSINRG